MIYTFGANPGFDSRFLGSNYFEKEFSPIQYCTDFVNDTIIIYLSEIQFLNFDIGNQDANPFFFSN